MSSSVEQLVIREEFPCGAPIIARFLDGLSNVPDVRLSELHLLTRPKSDASGCIPSLTRFLTNQERLVALTIPPFQPSEHRSLLDLVKAPQQLESLDLVMMADQPEACIRLLGTLPGLCSNLMEFGVVFLKRENAAFSMTFDYILPLLEIHTLENVEIVSDNGMALSEEEIRQMGKAWPRLYRLSLWPHGFQREKVGLSPRAVWSVAASFPLLEELGVYIDLNDEHPPTPHLQPPPEYPWCAFTPNLRALNVGGSRLASEHVNAMTEFLSAITQSPITLNFDGDTGDGPVNRDASRWTEARETYQMVMRIRGGVAGHAQLYINALARDHELLRLRLIGKYSPFI